MTKETNRPERRRNTDKLIDALIKIRSAAYPQDIERLLTSGVQALCFERWALIIGTKTDRAIDHRDLVGLTSCSGAWFSNYLAKHCIQIDPFFVHCHHSNLPVVFPCDVSAQSSGQESFLATLSDQGFAYGVAIPIHLAQERLAMFYVGSRKERDKPNLYDCAPLLSALGQEAAIWLETQRMTTAINSIPPLTDMEIEHLLWVLKGFQSTEIAGFTKNTVSTTNNVFRRINEKLGTCSRKEAAIKAEKLGLLRATQQKSDT